MKLLLLSLSRETWESPQVKTAFEQVRDAARRIDKKVDLRHERIRFSRACESIETLARENNGAFFEVSGHQAQELLNQLPKQGSIKLNFIPPSDLKQLAGRVEALREVPRENGLVVLPIPSNDPAVFSEKKSTVRHHPKRTPDFSECGTSLDSISDDLILRRFHDDLRKALQSGECLGLGGYRHETFVRGVRDYINIKEQPFTQQKVKMTKDIPDEEAIAKREAKIGFRLKKWLFPSLLPKDVPMKTISVWGTKNIPAPAEPVYLRIAFQDGSEGKSFPLFCLPKRSKPTGLNTISAALVSSRHFELDAEIDLYILRNFEISRREDESFADQEHLAFERAMETFQSFIKHKPGAEIHFYHTGLEPAVVGAYRAIMEILRWPENRGRLVVTPKLYRGNHYIDLDSWF